MDMVLEIITAFIAECTLTVYSYFFEGKAYNTCFGGKSVMERPEIAAPAQWLAELNGHIQSYENLTQAENSLFTRLERHRLALVRSLGGEQVFTNPNLDQTIAALLRNAPGGGRTQVRIFLQHVNLVTRDIGRLQDRIAQRREHNQLMVDSTRELIMLLEDSRRVEAANQLIFAERHRQFNAILVALRNISEQRSALVGELAQKENQLQQLQDVLGQNQAAYACAIAHPQRQLGQQQGLELIRSGGVLGLGYNIPVSNVQIQLRAEGRIDANLTPRVNLRLNFEGRLPRAIHEKGYWANIGLYRGETAVKYKVAQTDHGLYQGVNFGLPLHKAVTESLHLPTTGLDFEILTPLNRKLSFKSAVAKSQLSAVGTVKGLRTGLGFVRHKEEVNNKRLPLAQVRSETINADVVVLDQPNEKLTLLVEKHTVVSKSSFNGTNNFIGFILSTAAICAICAYFRKK